MKKLLFTFLLLIAFPAMASHIVGGEFELLYVSGNTYQVNMILYFDRLHGNPQALDLSATAVIYRKSDNLYMGSVLLPLTDSTNVGYTQPACANGDLETSKLVYTGALTLSPDVYNDPGGYYMSWQRCCRNYTITNIYSEDPSTGGITAGQTFYLEFPPVVKNGQPFINSSPHLFPPLNDYACPGRPYYVNFAGVDPDNDSLVYTMVTPLNTTSSDALPAPSPAPYPLVQWRYPPFGITNIIDGKPDLRISLDGFITCTPTVQGLFVFAVRVEQYRGGVKIGESRRDFQMLVVDGCQPDSPPQILGKKLTDSTFTYSNTMAVSFVDTVTNNDRCIQVQVSDPDTENPLYNYTQIVTIKAIPINFKDTTLNHQILPPVTTATLMYGAVADFSICFPQCPLVKSGTYEIGLVAYDNACSLPLTDTLKVTVTVQPPVNSPPYFTIPTTLPLDSTLLEGTQATWPFQVVDKDLDSLVVAPITKGFLLSQAGMTFTILSQQKGLVNGQLHWDAYCNIYNFTQRTRFQVNLLADDKNICNLNSQDTAVFNLSVILPGVSNPVLETNLTSNPTAPKVLGLVRSINDSLSFTVTGTQADSDYLVLGVIPNGFALSNYQMTFPPASGSGLALSHFRWGITCSDVNLVKRDTFDFHFVVIDSTNKCKVIKADTVEVSVKVDPQANVPPMLSIESLNAVPLNSPVNIGPGNYSDSTYQVSIVLGQPLALSVLGAEANAPPDKDSLSLTLLEATGNVSPEGYSFTGAKGIGSITSPFLWSPDCSIFQKNIYNNNYTFKFKLLDSKCFNVKDMVVTLDVQIADVAGNAKEFDPPNVITPNGDHLNDYFALDGIDADAEASQFCECNNDPDAKIALPKDNCQGRFQTIRIFNRWGKQVFQSSDRTFRWYAQSQDAGEYYYFIEFSNREYKGWISVRP